MQQMQQPNADARGRARRAYGVAIGASALGLTALGTVGLAGTAGATNGVVTRTVAVGAPVGSATPGPAAATAPQMRLQLAYQRVGEVVTLTISLDGHVHAPLGAKNVPLRFPTPARRNIGLGEELAWGDGTSRSFPRRAVHCGEPKRLHQVADSYKVTKKYAGPGTYVITYSFKACGLTGDRITARLPITF